MLIIDTTPFRGGLWDILGVGVGLDVSVLLEAYTSWLEVVYVGEYGPRELVATLCKVEVGVRGLGVLSCPPTAPMFE